MEGKYISGKNLPESIGVNHFYLYQFGQFTRRENVTLFSGILTQSSFASCAPFLLKSVFQRVNKTTTWTDYTYFRIDEL